MSNLPAPIAPALPALLPSPQAWQPVPDAPSAAVAVINAAADTRRIRDLNDLNLNALIVYEMQRAAIRLAQKSVWSNETDTRNDRNEIRDILREDFPGMSVAEFQHAMKLGSTGRLSNTESETVYCSVVSVSKWLARYQTHKNKAMQYAAPPELPDTRPALCYLPSGHPVALQLLVDEVARLAADVAHGQRLSILLPDVLWGRLDTLGAFSEALTGLTDAELWAMFYEEATLTCRQVARGSQKFALAQFRQNLQKRQLTANPENEFFKECQRAVRRKILAAWIQARSAADVVEDLQPLVDSYLSANPFTPPTDAG